MLLGGEDPDFQGCVYSTTAAEVYIFVPYHKKEDYYTCSVLLLGLGLYQLPQSTVVPCTVDATCP